MPGYTARVFVLESRTGCYEMRDATEMSVACRDSFAADDPLMAWLKTRGSCSQYSEFTRSRHFRAFVAEGKRPAGTDAGGVAAAHHERRRDDRRDPVFPAG